MPPVSTHYARANSALCPEARARKVEDLKVPGAWPKDQLQTASTPVVSQRPELALSLLVPGSDRRPNGLLRAAVNQGNDNSPVQWQARFLSTRPSISAGRLAVGIGAAAGYIYAMTAGVVVHEVLGHEILGHNAILKFPVTEPRLYWTDAVQKAAREGLPTVDPDTRFWQADWLDRMSVNGAVEGTLRTVAAMSGKAIAPNDTAWAWNDPNDNALQAVLAAFATNQTARFDASAGCINAVYHGAHERTSFGLRLGSAGGQAWTNMAGSIPGFALVSAAYLAALYVGKRRPLVAEALNTFGTQLHTTNVFGALGDIGGMASAASNNTIGQAMVMSAILYTAATLPFVVDAAVRASHGVNKELVSDQHALRHWLRRASQEPRLAEQLNTLLAAYPGRSNFSASTDVRSRAFVRQLMDCNAYLQKELAAPLAHIKVDLENSWRSDPRTQRRHGSFDTAQATMEGARIALGLTAVVSACIKPGNFFSGQVVWAAPAFVAAQVGKVLIEAAKNQSIRSDNRDPGSLTARLEAVLDRLF